MDDRARLGKPPNRSRDRAQHQLRPDAGQGDHQALRTGSHHRALGGVRIKCRGQKNQRESHGRNSPAAVLASMGVSVFMNGDDEHPQRVED